MTDRILIDRLGFKWLIRESSLFEGIVQDGIGYDMEHEIENLKTLMSLGDPSKTFVDVGAHVGYYSVRLTRHYARILAIEPDPFNAEGLRANLGLNGIQNVTVLEVAASSKKGEAQLLRACGRSRLNFRSEGPETLLVKIDLLDNLVDHADVIKIDTEGHEVEVLEGSKRLISTRPVLMIENHEEISEHELPASYWSDVVRILQGFSVKPLECSCFLFVPCQI